MMPPAGLRKRGKPNGHHAGMHPELAPTLRPPSPPAWKTAVRWLARLGLVAVLFLSFAKVVHIDEHLHSADGSGGVLAGAQTVLLVITHSRADYLARCLRSLFSAGAGASGWPILVSADMQDGAHADVDATIAGARVRAAAAGVRFASVSHSEVYGPPPDVEGLSELQEMLVDKDAYVRIARHYRWAIRQAFAGGARRVVVVEDDMEVAADFFSYFDALAPVLEGDPTLWCVSAWNDNGKRRLAVDERQLHRTDFFPGLGWMLTRRVWEELQPKWPDVFWDDWMRQEAQKRGRQCVRPEVSRTRNFGEKGASTSFQYEEHVSQVALAQTRVNFSSVDLSYLAPERYDAMIFGRMSRATRLKFSNYLTRRPQDADVIAFFPPGRLAAIGKRTGIMTDDRNGVYRTAYKGVIVIPWNGHWAFLVEQGFRPPEGYELGARECCD